MSSNEGDAEPAESDVEGIFLYFSFHISFLHRVKWRLIKVLAYLDDPIDEHLLQSRRAILQQGLLAVERHFSSTKQQLFNERSDLYEIRITQLKETPDTHPDLKNGISELMDEIDTRQQTTTALKDLKLKSVISWFNAEKQMIEQTLEMKKVDEKNKMREKLENKLCDLQVKR